MNNDFHATQKSRCTVTECLYFDPGNLISTLVYVHYIHNLTQNQNID